MTLTVPGSDVLNLPDHCGKPMVKTRLHFWWEGEFELEEVEAKCKSCPTTLTMRLSVHVGPPAAARTPK